MAPRGQRRIVSVLRESGRSRGYWQSLRGYRPVDAKVHYYPLSDGTSFFGWLIEQLLWSLARETTSFLPSRFTCRMHPFSILVNRK